MPEIPNASAFIGDTVTEAQFKSALKSLVDNLISKDYVQQKKSIVALNLDLNQIVDDGVYHIPTTPISASLLNKPDGLNSGGVLIVKNSQGDVAHQTIISHNLTASRFGTKIGELWSFTAWTGVSSVTGSIVSLSGISTFQSKSILDKVGADLNSYTSDSIVHITSGGVASSLLNRPDGLSSGGLLIVKNSGYDVAHQTIIVRNGVFSRFGTRANAVWTFTAWSGIKFNDSILDTSVFERKAEVLANQDLDLFRETGTYHVPTTGVMSTLVGKPSNAINGGVLIVKRSIAAGTTHQVIINAQGLFTRFEMVAGWQPWFHIPNDEAIANKIQSAISQISSDSRRNEVTSFGSSTLWYLGNELQEMCNKYGRRFNNCGVSGETIQGLMTAQGSIKMTGYIEGGLLPTSGVFRFVATFDGLEPTHMHSDMILDNGVQCRFVKVSDGQYDVTPLNNTTAMDTTGVIFNVWNPFFGQLEETIHIINAGKNNIGSSATAEQIYAMTVQMIEHIKAPRRFVVAGHFSNTGESDAHIAKVERVNALLWAKYNKFYVDLNSLLFSDSTWDLLGLTKTQADIDAIARRTLPPSLSRDSGHLSAGMDIVFCNALEQALVNLGYLK